MSATTPAAPHIVLASSSPRRRELLTALGLRFTVRPGDVDESLLEDESPADYVLRLARAKAAAVAHVGEIVLGADTTVVLDGVVLGKPLDEADGRQMLRALSGREHVVLTAVALCEPSTGRTVSDIVSTRVRMAAMTDDEIAWYVATGEPLDKAGSYGVQGLGALFVEEVFGNYTNVVGLPVPLVRELFARLGHRLEHLHG